MTPYRSRNARLKSLEVAGAGEPEGERDLGDRTTAAPLQLGVTPRQQQRLDVTPDRLTALCEDILQRSQGDAQILGHDGRAQVGITDPVVDVRAALASSPTCRAAQSTA
ncbi:hypothetical protein [Streptomyces sp. NBC_00038]|uniref:hypothetical protein n=1 Tax=Streptomyces sp. NBC_00038 TaxID=2903615 RepID=UPI00224FA1A6|nr:hypothetical protein [Streptomyces sp. NBC_00038]MCX5562904.1 hypothetical protein [Streptomyces sp. NBC_00038]